MKIGYLQYAVIQRDREANLNYIEEKLKNKTFDLLVLPELFTSGYAFDTKEEILPFVENIKESYTINRLTKLAKRSHGYIVGTIPELSNDKIYNTAITVGPEGLVSTFRKIHITDYEQRIFSAGHSIEVCKCNKAHIGTMICFDCWFPPLSSKLRQLGAQIICHPSCFGGEVTPTIIPIRALENQCFIISCNRIGEELFDGVLEPYRGESQIVNPDGKVLIQADNQEQLALIDIDLTEVNNPEFGSYISSDFLTEHKKYEIKLTENNK